MEFRILGPLEVVAGEQRLRLGGPKQRAALALLLLRANQAVPTDQLIEELWEGRPPSSALSTLRGYLSHLRGVLAAGGHAALRFHPPGYLLEVDPERVDAARFERLVRQGREALASGDPGAAASALRAALGLWRGPALADLADLAATRGARARLEELRLAALEARIDADLALGRHAELAGELEALTAEHPLRERLHAQRMLALYRSGRQADALAAYQQARRFLAGELGIEPGAELRQLQQAILRQEAALDWAPPARPALPAPLAGDRAVPAGPALAVAGGADPFVGREAELAQLRLAVGAARAGRGRVVLLAGEPGIGKTRTARELAAAARAAGMEVLWGRAWEEEGAPAFWPWAQALRAWAERQPAERLAGLAGGEAATLAQLVPVLAGKLGVRAAGTAQQTAKARFQLFDAVTRLLSRAAAERPLLLVLDDLHQADVPSLRLAQFLARELADTPILFLATYRDVEERRASAFLDALADLLREPVTRRLRLGGLEEGETARYLELVTGAPAPAPLVAELHARTGGNPFYLGELVRFLLDAGGLERLPDLGEQVPQGVLAAVGRRLGALPGGARAVLTTAAVVGQEFSLDLLASIDRTNQDALLDLMERAAVAGLVTEVPGAPGRYRFTHVLVRDALYSDLSSTRRARLHRQAGEALERLPPERRAAHLAELARHFLQATGADARQKAARYAALAGEHAMTLLAWEEAARLFRLALEHEDEPERRCALLLELAEAEQRAGNVAAGRQACLEAAGMARSLGLAEVLARAVLWYGEFLDFGVYNPVLVELCEEALRALAPGGDPALRVKLLGRLAMALSWAPARGPAERAAVEARCQALGQQAVATARELGDPGVLAYALHARNYVLAAPEHAQERLAAADEIVRLAVATCDRDWEVQGRGWRVFTYAELGDFAAVDREVEAYARVAEELRVPLYRPWVWLWKALRACMAGDLEAAERLSHASLAGAGDPPEAVLLQAYGAQVWMLRREQDRLGELEATLAGFLERFPDLPAWRAALALVHAHTGRHEAARAELERLARDRFGAIPRDRAWLTLLAALAEVCVLLGEERHAAVLYELLLPFERRCAVAFAVASLGPVALHLGRLAALLGRPDAARRHLEVAVEEAERLGAPRWLAQAREHLAA